jgi:hypothetical protein
LDYLKNAVLLKAGAIATGKSPVVAAKEVLSMRVLNRCGASASCEVWSDRAETTATYFRGQDDVCRVSEKGKVDQ